MRSKEERRADGPRVVVVGCGRWGRNHVRNYADLGALAGIVDERPEVAAELSAAHCVPALTLDAALADPEVAGLVFALPPSRNLPLGRRVLAAGKHLFVEKPLALSVADGAALCQAADDAGRALMVGHILQYHPAFRALADLVAAGRLGRLLSLVSTRLDLGRVRREEDALWALAPHDVSMILTLAGTEPTGVSASGGYHTHPTIADAAAIELAFPGGPRAEIRASWLHPIKEQQLVAVGTDAMAVFDDRAPWPEKLLLHPYRLEAGETGPAVARGEPSAVAVDAREPLGEECRAFLRAIASGDAPPSDGREGLRVLSVLERASAAMLSHR